MYPIPLGEILVENRKCRFCSAQFPITDKDLEFYAKVSPIFDDKRYLIPPPTLCPDCRQQRRLLFRNERNFYKRKSDFTGQEIISLYSPDKPYKVYEQKTWWGDEWDAGEYEREFDFTKNFFDQFYELQKSVPRIAIMNDDGFGTSENSTYCQDFAFGKNCYFVNSSWYIEDSLYSDCVMQSKNIVDSMMIFGGSEIYESIHCRNVYNSRYIQFCNNSNNCLYSSELEGCNHCLGCHGLRNKSYCILNKQYSKEEYEVESKKMLSQKEDFLKQYSLLRNSLPRKALNITLSENAIGDNILSSADIVNSFDIVDSRNLRYCTRVNTNAEDCMDVHQSGDLHLVYEGLTPDKTYKGAFITWCWENCKDIYYSDTCITCSDCFGCIGLKNKSYCILNKQYTKEEYDVLVPRIIEKMISDGEWGEFFPSSLSAFGYNETIVKDYFPMTKDEATKEGKFLWSDYEASFPQVEKTIPGSKLPDSIEEIPDDILNWAIECEVSKKPFRIIRQELEFYRKHNLPIPRRHPDQRHIDRMKMRNPRKLFERVCDCQNCEKNWKKKGLALDDTNSLYREVEISSDPVPKRSQEGRGKKMITTYAPERPERVYCEVCYEKEVMT